MANSAYCEGKLMEENSESLVEELSGKDVPMSVVFSEVKNKLAKAGIEASSEAEWLIAESLNKNRNTTTQLLGCLKSKSLIISSVG